MAMTQPGKALLLVVALGSLSVLAALVLQPSSPGFTTVRDPVERVHPRHFQVRERGLDGAIVQAEMLQTSLTSGPSPDVIVVTWAQPVIVRGVSISVDVGGGTDLVEVAVGRNWENYSYNDLGGLLHTSYFGETGGAIDEQIWFSGSGVAVDTDEWVAVTAWLRNATTNAEVGISPEVILYFEPATGAHDAEG